MTYREWFEAFAHKHRGILATLEGRSEEEILEYFRYDNMRKRHPDFCPLYATAQKCHDLEDLNCYFCGCPHFRYCDEGIERVGEKVRYSLCAIGAAQSKSFETDTAIHQDCSACLLPHRSGWMRKHFDRDWSAIMSQCQACASREEEPS